MAILTHSARLPWAVPAATLLEFAQANDSAAATTKKLEKQAILASYFRTLEEIDLRLSVRYAAGRAFAGTDERVLNVGSSLVSETVLTLLPLDGRAYHDLVVRSGEIGEAISKVWETRKTPLGEHPPLLLSDVATAFDALAATGAWESKRAIFFELLARCQANREAAYVAKIVSGDLRTGVQEGVLQAAVAEAFGRPLADVRLAQLLVGDLDEVAVLAKADELGSAAFRLFHPIQAMLATPQETPADAAETLAGRAFYVEDKLDGIRAQVHKAGGVGQAARVAIYTRTMDRADASFPDVVEAISQIPGDFLIDGEIAPWRDGKVLPFAHIQKRLGRKTLTVKMLRENPAVLIGFDLLHLNGELLLDKPLRERRELLKTIPSLIVTEVSEAADEAQIAAAFDAARARRNEGIMLKDPESPYSPGRRGKLWLKLKTHLPTLDCVVTAAEYGHGKRRNVLSDYTFAVWDRDPAEAGATLVNIGKAYSGVTDEEIAQLTELFLSISLGGSTRVHQVRPQVVLEIAFDQIQKSARHAGGFALRFPRIKRIRWDKTPADADRLERVVEIHRSAANTAWHADMEKAEKPMEPTLFDGLQW